MVVCAMQSFATEPQINGCSALKSPQSTQSKNAAIVDNNNGADEDREEGEIVDEFEMIISSEDEEFKLRARIQQLEDKSKDIEKMEMLSANLANQYNFQRPQALERFSSYSHFSPISVLSDVSSLSGEEFEPPKRHRKHKMKRSEPKKHGQLTRRSALSRSHTQQQQLRKRRRHEHHNSYGNHYAATQKHAQQHQEAAILLDSLDSVTDDELVEYNLNGENDSEDNEDLEQLKLSRNKLLVALGRAGNHDIKPKYSLKERLQYCPRKSPSPDTRPAQSELKPDDQLPAHSFEGYSKHRSEDEEERETDEPAELKLRLIALKSAILKKHMARKKRDAERAYSPTDMINRVHEPTTINNACDDIDDLMEISPAASPERTAYSPPPPLCEEPVDMELAQTDSDEERQQWPQNWQGTLHSESSWPCFLPHALPPVSIPIVVDDDDEEEEEQRRQQEFNIIDDEVPPPPPSYHIPQVQLEDDDARDALHLSDRQSQHGSITDIQSISMDNSETRPFPAESSDDEAGALRAMLLSKLKPTAKPVSVLAKPKPDAQDSDDPEELRLLLLSSIATKKNPDQDSPEILKKAVRRFQTSTMSASPPLPAETSENAELLPNNQMVDVAHPLAQVTPATESASELVAESSPVTATVSIAEPVPEPLPVAKTAPLPVPPPVPVPSAAAAAPAPTPAPTPALPPAAADIIKIVKPNKVINKKTAPKRKISKLTNLAPPIKRPSTLLVKESVAPLHGQNTASSTRLITTLDPSSITVNKLIISLAESSAGSDDELELKDTFTYSSYTSYADNASPLSQALESASNSTTRSNTPNSEILDSTAPSNPSLRRTVINEYFEKKLDDYLKQARSKVPTALPLANASAATSEETDKTTELQTSKVAPQSAAVAQKTKPTPVAVRHLPVASQREYLRLVERMRLLEKKKIGSVKAKANGQAAKAATTVKVIKKAVVKAGAKSNVGTVSTAATTETSKKNDASDSGTVNGNANGEVPSSSGVTSAASQPSKESRLKAFENSFLKIGGSMITNLDKSLHMVEEARRSKVARLRYSQRLKELHAEMLSVKQTLKLEEARLARIQPEIQASHEIIISLKQRRNKLRKAATDLGTDIQGADYRLLDPGKADISRKSTQLTKEIRLYNTLHKFEDIVQPVSESTSKAEAQPPAEPVAEDVPNPAVEAAVESVPEPNEAEGSQTQVKETCTQTETIEKTGDCDNAAAKDVDMTPQDAAPKDVPLYIAGVMRFLRKLPYEGTLLGEYRTPMLRNYNRYSQLNVNATMCPFDLMGRCEDADCSYLHLTREELAARPDAITASAD